MVFGPGKRGAQLEADKSYAKKLMRAAAVPTAESQTFSDHRAAREYIETREHPPVIKAAGLARGKGVLLPETIEEALGAVDRIMLERVFGDAGNTIVIE